MGDTWWAFVAGIDRVALMQELPGSPSDRRMREDHEALAAGFWAMRRGLTVFTKPNPKPATVLDQQLAAYAAKKRNRKAA